MMGIDATTQRTRMVEALDAILPLLRGESVTMETDWFTLRDARLQLSGYTQPHLPVAVAHSLSPSGPQTAGRFGLGMLSVATAAPGGVGSLEGAWQWAQEPAEESGAEINRDEWRVTMYFHLADSKEEALAQTAEACIAYNQGCTGSLGVRFGEGEDTIERWSSAAARSSARPTTRSRASSGGSRSRAASARTYSGLAQAPRRRRASDHSPASSHLAAEAGMLAAGEVDDIRVEAVDDTEIAEEQEPRAIRVPAGWDRERVRSARLDDERRIDYPGVESARRARGHDAEIASIRRPARRTDVKTGRLEQRDRRPAPGVGQQQPPVPGAISTRLSTADQLAPGCPRSGASLNGWRGARSAHRWPDR